MFSPFEQLRRHQNNIASQITAFEQRIAFGGFEQRIFGSHDRLDLPLPEQSEKRRPVFLEQFHTETMRALPCRVANSCAPGRAHQSSGLGIALQNLKIAVFQAGNACQDAQPGSDSFSGASHEACSFASLKSWKATKICQIIQNAPPADMNTTCSTGEKANVRQ